MDDRIQGKVDGLVALMKRGIYEGERTQARRALERLCKKHDLNIEDVLREEQPVQQFSMKLRTTLEADIFSQCVFRFAEPELVGTSWSGKTKILYECTAANNVQLLAVWPVIRRALKAELEVFKLAFMSGNGLLGTAPDDAPEPTDEEKEKAMRAALMSQGIKKAQIHKQIT